MDKRYFLVCLRATANLDFAIANLIISFETNTDIEIDYKIFCESDAIEGFIETKKVCSHYNAQLILENYTLPNIAHVTENFKEYIQRYPSITFSLFEIFNQLDYYSHVLFIDIDTIVLKDIKNIVQYGPFSFRYTIGLDACLRNNSYGNIDTINAGLLYANDTLANYKELSGFCYNILEEEFENIIKCYDQVILTLLVKKYKVPYTLFDKFIYNCNAIDRNCNTRILHFISTNKPWDNKYVRHSIPEYTMNESIKNAILHDTPANCRLGNTIEKTFYQYFFQLLYEELVRSIPISLYPQICITNNCFSLYCRDLPRYIHYEFIVNPRSYFFENTFAKICAKNGIHDLQIELHIENNTSYLKKFIAVLEEYTKNNTVIPLKFTRKKLYCTSTCPATESVQSFLALYEKTFAAIQAVYSEYKKLL